MMAVSECLDEGQGISLLVFGCHDRQEAVQGNVHDVKGPPKQEVCDVYDHIFSNGTPYRTKPQENVIDYANHRAKDQHRSEFSHFGHGKFVKKLAHDRVADAVRYLGNQEQSAQRCRIKTNDRGIKQCEKRREQRHQRNIADIGQEETDLFQRADFLTFRLHFNTLLSIHVLQLASKV